MYVEAEVPRGYHSLVLRLCPYRKDLGTKPGYLLLITYSEVCLRVLLT